MCISPFNNYGLFTEEAVNVGDLVQGAEADGDGIGAFCEFHRALDGGGDGIGGFDRAVEVRTNLGFQFFRP